MPDYDENNVDDVPVTDDDVNTTKLGIVELSPESVTEIIKETFGIIL